MLVVRYFMFVGGALLALLLLGTAVLPKPPATDDTVASASDVPAIRIHSQQKWPERVVFDTNAPMPAPATLAQAAAPTGGQLGSARVREAFAQLPAAESKGVAAKEQAVAEVKKPEPKPPVKRRIARARPAPQPYPPGYYGNPQYYPQERMQVAQQPRYGFLW